MRRSILPMIVVPIAVLILIGIYWFYTGPDHDSFSTLPDDEIPLGAPETAWSEYRSGYGLTWSRAASGDLTAFIGYSGGQEVARLTVMGNTGSDESLIPGITRDAAEKILGAPLLQYNRTRISALNSAAKSFYSSGNDIMIVYYDTMDRGKAVFVLRVDGDFAARTRFFTSSEIDPFSIEETEAMAMDLMNGVRLAYGRPALKNDLPLTTVARGHSRAMVEQNFFSHDSPAGQKMKDRLNLAGIQYKNSGEALTAGTWTPMDAIMAWMNSPAHRAILLGDYTSAAIGVANGNSAYGIYYTLNVIKN